jgi:hypothetical protein
MMGHGSLSLLTGGDWRLERVLYAFFIRVLSHLNACIKIIISISISISYDYDTDLINSSAHNSSAFVCTMHQPCTNDE